MRKIFERKATQKNEKNKNLYNNKRALSGRVFAFMCRNGFAYYCNLANQTVSANLSCRRLADQAGESSYLLTLDKRIKLGQTISNHMVEALMLLL